jgi:lysophospholipid acyltransferase (LPLAT)-like uncharacterized protein
VPSPAANALWAALDYPLATTLFVIAKLIHGTSRVTEEGAPPECPSIFVNFHHHQPLMQPIHGPHRRWMMVSRAPPLRPVARYTRWMGMSVARGASGGGGREALTVLAKALRDGASVSIAVDGPAGPAYKVKRGCIDLAQETGAPIVPIAYECARGLETWRWDHASFPTPLDRVVVRYGPALDVAGLPLDEALRVVEEAMLANGGPRRSTRGGARS